MNTQIKILRKLARKYFEIAMNEKNHENLKLHKAVNDLKQIRPVVLIDELPWGEMNINDELTIQCTDPFLREVEWHMRTTIYKHKHFPADMVVKPYIAVSKIINSTGNGLSVKEKTIAAVSKSSILSHEYEDQLATEEDLDKLHAPMLTYDKVETMRRYNLVGDILGDIIPVKITGINAVYICTWDNIATYRGVTNLLMDLAERPEFMHKIVSKLTEFACATIDQYERLDFFDSDPTYLHCTCAATDDLPGKSFDGEHLTRKNVWGRGMAQIFASVSKEMHEEFDIEYMKKTIGQCGLVYYGCCEPLDKKIDIVEKIPNLRKISITPWANIDVAAEAINTRYVLASKPNPASVAAPMLDKENLKKEITHILNACKKNNCSCDIVLKDISTCCNRPENIFEWGEIVMELVKNY